MTETDGRVRALILIQADAPAEAAQALYDELVDAGGDDFVIVRADVVDYVYNVVIPVDAASQEWLDQAHQTIKDVTGARYTLVIPVVQHVPFPPHNAQGYITAAEAEAGVARGIEPGRQHASPGENAWG